MISSRTIGGKPPPGQYRALNHASAAREREGGEQQERTREAGVGCEAVDVVIVPLRATASYNKQAQCEHPVAARNCIGADRNETSSTRRTQHAEATSGASRGRGNAQNCRRNQREAREHAGAIREGNSSNGRTDS